MIASRQHVLLIPFQHSRNGFDDTNAFPKQDLRVNHWLDCLVVNRFTNNGADVGG